MPRRAPCARLPARAGPGGNRDDRRASAFDGRRQIAGSTRYPHSRPPGIGAARHDSRAAERPVSSPRHGRLAVLTARCIRRAGAAWRSARRLVQTPDETHELASSRSINSFARLRAMLRKSWLNSLSSRKPVSSKSRSALVIGWLDTSPDVSVASGKPMPFQYPGTPVEFVYNSQ